MKKHFYHYIAFLFSVSMLAVSAGAVSNAPDTSKAISCPNYLFQTQQLCKSPNASKAIPSFLCKTQQLCKIPNTSKAVPCLNSLFSANLLCWNWCNSTICNKPDQTPTPPKVPDTKVPDTKVPDTKVPDTMVPDTKVPDTKVPDTMVPDTKVPDTKVPDTKVPDTKVPDTKVPDTKVPDDSTGSQGLSAFESKVVSLVNEQRQREGLSPLRANVDLSHVARLKSQDMADKNYFSHTSPTYGSPFEMMKSFGISYRTAGENIAYGQSTPEAVVEAWMNSAGHRANILNPAFTEIGVGYVSAGHYWTQMFIG